MTAHYLHLRRWTNDERPTLGGIHYLGDLVCGCVEDRYRQRGVKVAGDTRIPPGDYPLRWRDVGRWAQRFQAMGFPGSLEVCDVPAYTDVLAHIGNTQRDTRGCLLPNYDLNLDRRTGGRSRLACQALYGLVHATPGEWRIAIT